jgi:hypothetical protein
MAELKIKADSGGGTVSFKGPATTTLNAAVQLTLPVDDGTANQYLKTDGSGVLSWATVSSDVVGDTSPQLGGDLDVNGNQIKGDDVQIHAADDQVIAKFHKTNSSEFHFNGSKKLEVNNTGIGVTGSVTPSGGLYLGGSGGDNYLNDYEKGTWTAELQHSNGTAVTYSTTPATTECHYTKIGRMVLAHGYINNFDISGSGTGNPSISLPFQVATGASHCPGTLVHYTCFAHGNVRCLAEPSTSRLDFFQDNSTSRTTWNGNAATFLMFAVTYSSNT